MHFTTDIAANRLEVAKKLGADYTVLVEKSTAQEFADKITATMGGHPDITIECSGAEASQQAGMLVSASCP